MKINIIHWWCILHATTYLDAQQTLVATSYARESQLLNGWWKYIIDPYDNGYLNYRSVPYETYQTPGSDAYFTNSKPRNKSERIEYDFDKSDSLLVPGDWNSQKEKLFYYEGTVWYKRSFDYSKKNINNRIFLHFGAVNYRADVYLNGTKLGASRSLDSASTGFLKAEHKGGFTPFNFEVTGLLREKENFLVVRVNNMRGRDEVPTLNTDWWNYGGITRDVKLIEVPETFVRNFVLERDKLQPDLLTGFIQLDGKNRASQTAMISIPELKQAQKVTTNAEGVALIQMSTKGIQFWSPQYPKLYSVIVQCGNDTLRDRIGFRSIETKGREILLNGKPIFLRGISIHEENPLRGGRAHSMEDAKLLLTWAKELGCNFVRLAHYPHNEHMARLADEMGIMVWEEIPVYWTIQWKNEETFANASQQLRSLIERDINRASVIIWSMANETPVSTERVQFLKRLVDTARSIDNTRLISAALEQHGINGNDFIRTIDDPFAEFVDVVSFNQYIGWYDGLPDKCRRVTWNITQEKPVIVSEFGADAKEGFHADSLTRWSEEYQEYLYRETIAMIQTIPQLRGVTPWILVDFRSPRRVLPGIQDGWNRKGLISSEGKKKKAFNVLNEFYEQMKTKYENKSKIKQ